VRHRRPKIAVLGSMCLIPVPGVVFQLLHYRLGLESVGFETHYVEWHGHWVDDPYDPRERTTKGPGRPHDARLRFRRAVDVPGRPPGGWRLHGCGVGVPGAVVSHG
jgi:hypothetical protein